MLLTYLMFVNIVSVFFYIIPIRKNSPQSVKCAILSGPIRVKILVEEFRREKGDISQPREDHRRKDSQLCFQRVVSHKGSSLPVVSR